MTATSTGHTSLADHYGLRGESPGQWVGSGLVGIEGLQPGDIVTAEQMRSLFGVGEHPLAAERLAALGPVFTDRDLREATRLGQRFAVYTDSTEFTDEVGRRIVEWNRASGRSGSDPVARSVRSRIRTEVTRERFHAKFGREPRDARELSGFTTRQSRAPKSGVAGYDATFSPVKSVSALWALADRGPAEVIAQCHALAVADALRYIEGHALFTPGVDATASVR